MVLNYLKFVLIAPVGELNQLHRTKMNYCARALICVYSNDVANSSDEQLKHIIYPIQLFT